jgi:hypothetical protein
VESEIILDEIGRLFSRNNELRPTLVEFLFEDMHPKNFFSSLEIGPLNRFNGFNDMPGEDIIIGIACANDYDYNGQLEIVLWYRYSSSHRYEFTVFDKWSALANKGNLNAIHLKTGQNFFDRPPKSFLQDLAKQVFDKFMSSLDEMKDLIKKAAELPITSNAIVPVFLNLRNHNRSVTALQTNKARANKVKNDIFEADYRLGNKQFSERTYTIFLYLISVLKAKSKSSFGNYDKFKVRLSSSQEYQDLLRTVNELDSPEKKQEFERDQIVLFENITKVLKLNY